MAFEIFGSHRPTEGGRIDGVFEISHRNDTEMFSGARVPDGLPVLLIGAELTAGRFSVYGGKVTEVQDVLIICLDSQSWWTQTPVSDDVLPPFLVDLSAGSAS